MKYSERQELIQALEEMIEFFKRPESIALPCPRVSLHQYVYSHDSWKKTRNMTDEERKEYENRSKYLEFRKVAQNIGRATKDDTDYSMRLVKEFGPNKDKNRYGTPKLVYEVTREAVCERIETDEMVEEKIYDVVGTKLVPKVEWRCKPILSDS